MKNITENTIQEVITKVTDWYQWMIDNQPEKMGQVQIVKSKVGKISSRQFTVQLIIKDHNDSEFNVYITPATWWVKKVNNGQAYGFFSKKLIHSIDSYTA